MDIKKGLELVLKLVDALHPKVEKAAQMVAEYEVDRRKQATERDLPPDKR